MDQRERGNNMPRVSIGLPVFNGERFVESAIRCALDQTFEDFELIIWDNASTDRTPEICRDLAAGDPRISYSRGDANVGAARNFNRTFESATGEYFKWAACDDICRPQFLERCVAELDKDPELVLCHTKTLEIDVNGDCQKTYAFDMRTEDPRPHVRFRDLVSVLHPAVFVFGVIRRELLARTRLIGRYVSSDRVLLAELALLGKFRELDEPLFLRRIHEDNSVMLHKHTTMLEWYDPSKRGQISMPYWCLLKGYFKATKRHDLPVAERARCILALSGYLRLRRQGLIGDVRYAAARRVQQLTGIRRHPTTRKLTRATADRSGD
jgi:glycosyltransferase involved in cell wall biosynthesis